jgi:hypothetical protein
MEVPFRQNACPEDRNANFYRREKLKPGTTKPTLGFIKGICHSWKELGFSSA